MGFRKGRDPVNHRGELQRAASLLEARAHQRRVDRFRQLEGQRAVAPHALEVVDDELRDGVGRDRQGEAATHPQLEQGRPAAQRRAVARNGIGRGGLRKDLADGVGRLRGQLARWDNGQNHASVGLPEFCASSDTDRAKIPRLHRTISGVRNLELICGDISVGRRAVVLGQLSHGTTAESAASPLFTKVCTSQI